MLKKKLMVLLLDGEVNVDIKFAQVDNIIMMI